MAKTPSNMMPLGTRAPEFSLPDTVSGKTLSLTDIKSNTATVVMFICNHCPFVKHLNAKLVEVANHYIPKGISFVAISSNDVDNYPDDSPEKMKQLAAELGYPFAYLYDESQDTAKAYDAACTPDFYIFDGALSCVYRGQFDGSRPDNNVPVTGADLCNALDCILEGAEVPTDQTPSIGCNIKWKS
ncbi:MAG: thioredoxin family protein [Bdellovibrionales bacterium]|nr:thioredoxin family protein [Bdellovibrionales bacterium]